MFTRYSSPEEHLSQSGRFLSHRRSKKFSQCIDLSVDATCSSFNSRLYGFITSMTSLNFNSSLAHDITMPILTRILHAPGIVSDYNLNVLSWGDNDMLAVAIKNILFIYNTSLKVAYVLRDETALITSVAWMPNTKCIAVGDSNQNIRIYNIERSSKIRNIKTHSDRILSLAWNNNVLSSGSKNGSIIQHDMRMPNCFAKYYGHTREVCALQWNCEGTQLASGGNDNKIYIWGLGYTYPQLKLHGHSSKALAWCPYDSHRLASGGKMNKILLWNSFSGDCTKSVDTTSQVYALEWSKHTHEIVSAHGYSQFTLWKSQNMLKLGDFMGHEGRVLSMTQNPEGTSMVSAGSDETLRMYKLDETSKTESQSF